MNISSFLVDKALILVPVLYIIGCILKKSDLIKNNYIPLILLPLGILGAIGLMGVSADSVIQGILVTGVTVYGHQVCTKTIKKDTNNSSKVEENTTKKEDTNDK